MIILQAILLAVSLCADCFAVTTCSSVTLKSVTLRKVLLIAIVFATVQTLLMLIGWLFGDLFVGFISKAARWIGFLLLLYVGGSMILEGIRGNEEVRDLNGIKNVIIGAVATSIDALAVGISMSMAQVGEDALASDHALMVNTMIADHVAVFIVTRNVRGLPGGPAFRTTGRDTRGAGAHLHRAGGPVRNHLNIFIFGF